MLQIQSDVENISTGGIPASQIGQLSTANSQAQMLSGNTVTDWVTLYCPKNSCHRLLPKNLAIAVTLFLPAPF